MPKDNWRERARRIIEAYPDLQREEKTLHNSIGVSSYDVRVQPGGKRRTTEDTALRGLSREEERQLRSVENAIKTTRRYRSAEERIKVIGLVYWKQTHTLHGAALACNYSYETIQEWNADFIGLVDAYYRVT